MQTFMTVFMDFLLTLNASFTIASFTTVVSFFLHSTHLSKNWIRNWVLFFVLLLLERHEFTEIAKRLVGFCEFQIKSISNCVECYENKYIRPNEWRTLACSEPHLVLWAKLCRSTNFWPAKKGYTYWPAKLMSAGCNDGIKVLFFDHTEYTVIPSKQCNLFSIDMSILSNTKAKGNDIKVALKVI